jgi:hypothetical protein
MKGQIFDFYPESAIREACADLRQTFPQADESGFLEIGGLRYGTIPSWSKFLSIAEGTVSTRIKNFKIQSIKGKTKNGNICDFFLETSVCQICTDLLHDIPEADETGFFTKDGERYGTIGALAKALGISYSPINLRIKTHNPPSIKGKIKGGVIYNFYSESVIRAICSDLSQDIPKIDKTGTVIKDGEKYSTMSFWSEILGISEPSIASRIKTNKRQSIIGRDIQGCVRNLYSESVIREICADILQIVPEADESGFFVKENKKYSTISAWSKILGISKRVILDRAKTHALQAVKGKIRGHIYDFYPETEIRQICADLLRDNPPQADKEGFFIKDGHKYGTVHSLSKELGITDHSIASRISINMIPSTKGKVMSRHVCDFYPVTSIRQICADLLAKRKNF